jgi:nucleoside-diphosphate-sugar epimerase
MTSRSISLTGATGFVGWHVAEALAAAGWHVRAIVRRGNRKPLPEGVVAVEADLCPDSSSLANAVSGSSVVVHAAGRVRGRDERAFEATNIGGTRGVVEAANIAGARLILVSSQAAAGAGTMARPRREEDEPRPVTPYGRSKLSGEQWVRGSARVRWTILRPTAVYGPRDRALLPLFRLASRGVFLQPDEPALPVMFLYVEDLARAIVLAASSDRFAGETMFLGHPDPLSSAELLVTIADAIGRPYRPVRIPRPALQLAARGGDLLWRLGATPIIDSARMQELAAPGFVCSVARARAVLGFSARVSLKDGIQRTARWYRDRGWI